MADAFTTFLNLTNPEVGASSDSWGAKENTDRSTVDAMLSTMITGLTLSTAGGSGTFGIAIGAAAGMVLASAYTKTTSAWAVGTGNGGIDTGAIANATWYHVWLIQRADTGVVDILFSLSATSPTLPANYTRKRRIGSMKTDGSAHWKAFVQYGDEFIWTGTLPQMGPTPITGSRVLTALDVPTGVSVVAKIRGIYQDAVANPGGSALLMQCPDETDTTASVYSARAVVNTSAIGIIALNTSERTDTSGQVYFWGANLGTFPLYEIVTSGWIDSRGKA